MSRQRNEEQERARKLTRRSLVLGAAQLGLLGAVAGRLHYLQIVQGERYRLLAEDNRINLRLLPPPRGRIVDRFGAPLAVNQQNYRVLLVAERAADVEATLDRLSEIVPLDAEERARLLAEMSRRRSFVPLVLKENLSWEQVSRIEVNAPDLPGISIDVGETRFYPYGETMSHILGYVAAVSEREIDGDPLLELPGFRIGKNGMERMHDRRLRGTAGNSQIEVNAVGRVIQELARVEGEPGQEVVLTLDAGLQVFTHQRLMGERSASAVVLDAATGEVLSLASVPSYDPTPFSTGLSAAEWQALATDPLAPLSNKAISGLYAPGSTFKMMVALAALEAGTPTDHQAFCPGYMQLGNHRFHCWKQWGHGRVDMHDAIVQSCDVYFYDLAKRLGIDRIAAMAQRFGFGQTLGIDLPGERGGTMPTRNWKLATLGQSWQGGETLVAAIGQGFVTATPLQLAIMAARLANGGKAVVPHLTRGFRSASAGLSLPQPEAPDMGLPPEHLKFVLRAMDDVANDRRGTAYGSRIPREGWEMGGKTGTSQVRRITKAEREAGVVKNEDLPWRRRDHGLFVAFAPVERPRYACAVVVEHGGGGPKAAAPLARDILMEVQRRNPAGNEGLPMASTEGGRKEI